MGRKEVRKQQAPVISYDERAYHEAGHAVAAVLSRIAMARVAIFAEGDIGGLVAFPRPRPIWRVAFVRGPGGSLLANPRGDAPRRRTRDRVKRELEMTLGGCAAQALFLDPGPIECYDEFVRVADAAFQLLIDQGAPLKRSLRHDVLLAPSWMTRRGEIVVNHAMRVAGAVPSLA